MTEDTASEGNFSATLSKGRKIICPATSTCTNQVWRRALINRRCNASTAPGLLSRSGTPLYSGKASLSHWEARADICRRHIYVHPRFCAHQHRYYLTFVPSQAFHRAYHEHHPSQRILRPSEPKASILCVSSSPNVSTTLGMTVSQRRCTSPIEPLGCMEQHRVYDLSDNPSSRNRPDVSSQPSHSEGQKSLIISR